MRESLEVKHSSVCVCVLRVSISQVNSGERFWWSQVERVVSTTEVREVWPKLGWA